MQRRGRPVRGFFAGLILGIFLSIDLALMGAVKLDSAVLTILPVALAVIGLILGWWAPLGRAAKPPKEAAAPLPTPVSWPEGAPVEGSTAPPTQPAAEPPPPPPAAPPSI
jgi:hypothetical protein